MDLKNARITAEDIGLDDLTDNARPSVAPLSSSSETTTMAEANNSLSGSSPVSRPGHARSVYFFDEEPEMTGRKKESAVNKPSMYVMDNHAPPFTFEAVGDAKSEYYWQSGEEPVQPRPEQPSAARSALARLVRALDEAESSGDHERTAIDAYLAARVGRLADQYNAWQESRLPRVAPHVGEAKSEYCWQSGEEAVYNELANGDASDLMDGQSEPVAAAAAAAAEPSTGYDNLHSSPNTSSQGEGAASSESGSIVSTSSVATEAVTQEGSSGGVSASISSRTITSSYSTYSCTTSEIEEILAGMGSGFIDVASGYSSADVFSPRRFSALFSSDTSTRETAQPQPERQKRREKDAISVARATLALVEGALSDAEAASPEDKQAAYEVAKAAAIALPALLNAASKTAGAPTSVPASASSTTPIVAAEAVGHNKFTQSHFRDSNVTNIHLTNCYNPNSTNSSNVANMA